MDRRRKVDEYLSGMGEQALYAEAFDDAIIGVGEQCTKSPLVIYDWTKCVEILKKRGLTYEEAVEMMDFNVTGAWVGDQTPMFVTRVEDM